MNNSIISNPVKVKRFKEILVLYKKSILNNRINYDTLHQQDQKNLAAKNCIKAQSEITAELSDPEMSVLQKQKEGRQGTRR